MKTKTEHIERRFQKHLNQMDGALPELEHRIEHLPRVQMSELQERLHQVEVMEHAMRRNVKEVLEAGHLPEAERVRKLKNLARLIEAEMDSLQHDTDFMAQGYTSPTLETISRAADKLMSGARELLQALSSMRNKH